MTLEKLKCREGFTLVELLAVIAIMGIVISAAYTFLFANQSAYLSTMARIGAQSEAQTAINNIMTNIRRADQKELSKATFGSTLVLKIPDKNGDLTNFEYSIEHNAETDLYELILTMDTTRFVVATNIDGVNGFAVNKNGRIITVKIKTSKKIYNKIADFEVENYHEIKVDI